MFFRKKDRPLKKWHLALGGVIIVAAAVVRVLAFNWPTADLLVAGQRVHVLVADNLGRQIEGWSYKDRMGGFGGMLFPFPDRSDHVMVMRAMRFPLDIVWLDGDTVIHVAADLPPDPATREQDLTPYSAGAPSTAVVELPAGFATRYGLRVGDKISAAD